jgi:hypothetical protein
MAGRKLFNYLVALIIILNSIACNTGKNNMPQNDTGKTSSGVDSMPVVKPPVKDSGSILVTPPVNDSNVIKPDTTNSK